MLMIRDIMYCKPGKVKDLVQKFVEMAKIGEKKGWGKMRVYTDVSAERYWTVVAEMEVPSMDAFEKMMSGDGFKEADMKQFETIVQGYHELVDKGRREIYKLEG